MATITFDSGDVWDNTASGSTYDAKFTTKVGPGVGQISAARLNMPTSSFRGITGDTVSGRLTIVTGKISFDSSYPTGGEAADVIAGMMPKGVVLACTFDPLNTSGAAGTAIVASYDIANKKILVYTASGTGVLAEAANLSNFSTVTNKRFIAVGY